MELQLANLFIKSDDVLTEKHKFHCISFQDLGIYASNLFELIGSNIDTKPSYMLGFIPTSDNEVMIMRNSKIREICSALECELMFTPPVITNSDENLKTLITDVKRMIKDHRKGDRKLADKTYDMIFSSISHWNMSASDRITALYHDFVDQLSQMPDFAIPVSGDDISAFVKYRNNITHGSYRVLEARIAATAHILEGLVYCCLLFRIGLPREKISELATEKILT